MIAEAFGQSRRKSQEAAEEFFAVLAEKVAPFQQLQNYVGNLHQGVVIFHLTIFFAVGMLQIEPAVLLDIESFVFDFPAAPSSLIG